MIDTLQEEMNESITGIYTNTSKQYKRINKPRPESGKRINKENPNCGKSGKKMYELKQPPERQASQTEY